MFDTSLSPRLYEALPPPLPPTANPYGFLMKPLRAFLLSCVDSGNPAGFVPVATMKAAFELFLSSYLGDAYDPFGIIQSTNAARRQERRMSLEAKFRTRREGGVRILTIPNMAFLPLLTTTLGSKSFREESLAGIVDGFNAGRLPAANAVLSHEFMPHVARVGSRRVPVVFNASIPPVSKPLPDWLLEHVDPRFKEDPALSRETFTRFRLADLAGTDLDPFEVSELTRLFESIDRVATVRTKRELRRWNAKVASLYVAGVLKADDPQFLDRQALQVAREKSVLAPFAAHFPSVDTPPAE